MNILVAILVSFIVSVHGAWTDDYVPSVIGAFFEYKPLSTFSYKTENGQENNEETSVSELPANSPVARFSVPEKEFTALRIEYIKNQILKKLRLKEKPTITQTTLPRAVKEYENLLPDQDNGMHSSYSDDFYGKTTQAIIFPYEDEAKCLRKIRFPSACLPFQMPTDIHATELSTAELWFYKSGKSFNSNNNQTIIIYEVAHWDTKKSFQKSKPLAIQYTTREGWLKVDVSYIVKQWLEYQEVPTHAINVVCKTCDDMDKSSSPISFQSDLKPFLVIYTHSQQRKTYQYRRQKRSANCGLGVNECCRESLYVSFADIGWSDWIIKPEGYNAYFCKGSCMTASALTLSASQHNSILQKVMYSPNKSRMRPELTPCCAATQFQPLQLVYMDNNKTLTAKVLSNMIVETCGCM